MRSKLVPNPVTAPVVKRMFEECLAGKGSREIAKGLNDDGITTPNGKRWVGSAVLRILHNEAYTGTLVWGLRSSEEPLKVENAWPPIIDKETFAGVVSILESRGPKVVHPRRSVSEYLFSGLMKCGTCGSAMSGHSAKSGQFLYYHMNEYGKTGACDVMASDDYFFNRGAIYRLSDGIATPRAPASVIADGVIIGKKSDTIRYKRAITFL